MTSGQMALADLFDGDLANVCLGNEVAVAGNRHGHAVAVDSGPDSGGSVQATSFEGDRHRGVRRLVTEEITPGYGHREQADLARVGFSRPVEVVDHDCEIDVDDGDAQHRSPDP